MTGPAIDSAPARPGPRLRGSRGGSTRRAGAPDGAGHRLVGDSVTLVVAQAATAVLGLAYWAAAARGYPEAEVGRGAAVISSAIMLGTLSNLSFGAMYERFLPVAGRRAGAVILQGFAVSAVVAVVLSSALMAWGPREELFAATWELFAFPLLVVTLGAFILQDQIAVGLHAARWAALKNVAHSVAKLLAVLALVGTASATAIVGAWGVCALACCAVVAVAVRRRLAARADRADSPALPHRRDLVAYFAASYGTSSIGIVAPLVVPLLVVDRLGVEANAHFAVTWALTVAFLGLLSIVVGPYVAAASADPTRLRHLTQRIAVVLAAVGLGGGFFLAVVAPFFLRLVGQDYAVEGTPLLRLMAVALPFAVVGALYSGLARYHRRLRLTVVAQVLSALVVIGGAAALVGPFGLRGVGYAYVAAELVVCAVLVVPLARWLREALRVETPAGAGAGAGPVPDPVPAQARE